MFILYDLIFLVFALVYLPFFLLRGKMHAGFARRLGVLPKGLALDRPIWIHAVSVGEAASIRHLAGELRTAYPGKKFVISTVTTTGNRIAASIAAPGDFVTYLPLDLSFIVGRTLARINPCCLVIVETELWPNLIRCAARRGIPVCVVNGRISDKSFRRYRLVRPLLAPLLNKVAVFCPQSERDGERLARLGLRPGKIKATGNMKFDITVRDYDGLRKDYHDYRQDFGIGSGERLLVAASTHPGEEAAVIEVYRRVREKSPELRLLIAPRHPERSAELEALVRQAGLEPVRISSIAPVKGVAVPPARTGREIFILDTVGQLMYFYAISDIVFVGGSLVRTGGHNILEPASLGKPILFGPHMFNFPDITALFLEKGAARMVADKDELAAGIAALLADPAAVSALGAAARQIITGNQGATRRNCEVIKGVLSGARL